LTKIFCQLGPEEKAKIKATPGSLLEGGVFTGDLIETWISYRKKNEYEAVALRLHPYEFYLYYDI